MGSHFSLTYYLLVAVVEYLIKQLQAGGFVLAHSSRGTVYRGRDRGGRSR